MKTFKALLFIIGLSINFTTVGGAVPAIDFTMTDVNGTQHSLSDYAGKYVVLEWFNPDCPFVRKHYDAGNMQALQKEAGGKGVVWLSIDSSAPGKQGHYSSQEHIDLMNAKKGSPTAIFIDATGDMGRAYGAKTTPHMFIVDPKGELIYEGAIDSIASADSKDIQGSENYVRSALNQAMAGEPISNPSTRAYGCSVKY